MAVAKINKNKGHDDGMMIRNGDVTIFRKESTTATVQDYYYRGNKR